MSARVAALVLAAGRGARFGADRFKLLETLNGRPLLCSVVDAAMGSRARPVVVVTGHRRESVEAALKDFGASFVHNADHASGLASSLCAGLAEISDAPGALVLLGDMPLVTPRLLDRMILHFEESGAAAVVPVRNGRRGNPVLIGRRLFVSVASLRGDKGARDLLRAQAGVVEVEIDDDGVFADIDAPEDLAWLRASQRS